MLLLLFVPIGIIVDLAEKIDKMMEHDLSVLQIAEYYFYFTIYFANLLFPLFLFLSIIWFTSKLAENTEIVAFLSSGVSFSRFLRPYFMGATIVCLVALLGGMYVVPWASKGFNDFKYTYLKGKDKVAQADDIFRQINDNEYIYASSFRPETHTARDFILEHFEGNKLTYKITASRIRYNLKDSTYTLSNFDKRILGTRNDELISIGTIDTILPFEFDELTPVTYVAETLSFTELNDFIEQEKRRGSPNVNIYQVVAYKRWSTPVSAYILTIIAVAVSSMKRRGGMGVNLAIGISVAFVFVFLDKVFGTIAEQSTFSPLIAVWIPNIFFGIIAFFLLRKAKR